MHPAGQIAAAYFRHWLAQVRGGPVLYVDAFAIPSGIDRARSLPAECSAVLVQEDPVIAERLRTRAEGVPGVEVIEARFVDAVATLLERAQTSANVLVYLDPPTAGHLPLEAIRALLGMPMVDVWIRFPHEQLGKLARFRSTPVADLPPQLRREVEGYGRLFGDPRGEWLAEWRRMLAEQGSAAADRTAAARFGGRFGETGTGRALKTMELDIKGDEQLFLVGTSTDPRRLLALNAAVEDLELDGCVRWPGDRFRREPPPPLSEPLDLFPVGSVSAERRVLDEKSLSELLAARFAGRRVPFGEVLRSLLDTDLLPNDPAHAMRTLRRSRRVVYHTLRELKADVSFLEEPVTTLSRRLKPPLFLPATPNLDL